MLQSHQCEPDFRSQSCELIICRIDYAKKKEKRAVIKTQKDESVRGDGVYKSHTIVVASGESPNSGTHPSTFQYRLTPCNSI